MCKRIVLTMFFVVLSFATQSFGAIVLSWNTFGNAGTETTEPSVANAAGIAASNLTLGAGLTSSTTNANRFGGGGWFDTGNTAAGSTLAEAIAGNSYIEFIITPTGGATFTATSLDFIWDRSATGPSSVALRSSRDGFSANLGTVSGIVASALATNTINIAGITNVNTATTFRLYGFAGTDTAGTGGFDTSSNAANVIFNGTVTAVPEPSSLALLSVVLTGGVAQCIRRRAIARSICVSRVCG